jgi:Domain of unknown function (DUF4260)
MTHAHTSTDSTSPGLAGITTGAVRVTLRAENLVLLIALLVAYDRQQAGWALFATLILAPDLSMLPFLVSRAAGTVAYNAVHSFLGPLTLVGIAAATNGTPLLAVATIWAAYIAFDRALGYGLKYRTSFGDTHLGRVGKASSR